MEISAHKLPSSADMSGQKIMISLHLPLLENSVKKTVILEGKFFTHLGKNFSHKNNLM